MFDNPFMQLNNEAIRRIRQAINTVWALIAINVIVFLLTISNESLYMKLALSANTKLFRPWQLVSYMFMHGGFSHILFNMWGLYVFGTLLAPILGRKKFLILYFVSGITGGVMQLAASWNQVPSSITVGASGALFGVMMGVAMTRPNVEMYLLFFPMPIKMRTLIVVYALLEVFSQWQLRSNIAHLAHMGGFAGAYLYMIICCRKQVVWSLKNLVGASASGNGAREHFDRQAPKTAAAKEPGASGSGPTPHITQVSQKEVDRLLDKISQEGVNSLTDFERAELQFFREQMKNSGR